MARQPTLALQEAAAEARPGQDATMKLQIGPSCPLDARSGRLTGCCQCGAWATARQGT